MFLWLISFQFLFFNHGQGLSTAGSQKGLEDARSSLIKEVWRVADLFPALCGAEVQRHLLHVFFWRLLCISRRWFELNSQHMADFQSNVEG